MLLALVTMSATCDPTPVYPWCISLTAIVPQWSSCRLLSASCPCVPTTSLPWASLQKRWPKKFASIFLTSRSPIILILSVRPSVGLDQFHNKLWNSWNIYLLALKHFLNWSGGSNVVMLRLTLQQTAGLYDLMTPMQGETGAGHQPLGLKSWCLTC